LDRYRGYVGQSRATLATHTWNTRALDPADHGGRLVHPIDTPAEEVLTAMERNRAKNFAAFDDPYRLAEGWSTNATPTAPCSPADRPNDRTVERGP
jgi:hypothetical protein